MVYTVLARKYRPQKLSDLVGQETLVKVLTNSFKLNRIAHAFILTGSRGVGKTSTARIIAKGLNCEDPAKKNTPTIAPCGICSSCTSIAESRHIDVIEMDAASRTGVSDVREIIENIDYKTVTARFKVYIIDEVHMLSNSAFNALLKTLEEPPEHVKFIFATTEVTKIPTTVISRCQRFDLTRIEASKISDQLESICNKEEISFSRNALSFISNIAEGSLRDALSILDQAIVHGEGSIELESITSMLGLVDQNGSLKLFEHIIDQEQEKILEELDLQYKNGFDSIAILNGLMETISKLMIFKIRKEDSVEKSFSGELVQSLSKVSKRISTDILSRCWQMVLKNHGELKSAPDMFSALQMGMLRLSFFCGLPGPLDLIKQISEGKMIGEKVDIEPRHNLDLMQKPTEISEVMPGNIGNSSESLATDPERSAKLTEDFQFRGKEKKKIEINDFDDILSLIEEERNLPLLVEIENNFKLISFTAGEIEFDLTQDARSDLVLDISKLIAKNSELQWKFVRVPDNSALTVVAKRKETRNKQQRKIDSNLVVKEIKRIFPGARIGKSTFH